MTSPESSSSTPDVEGLTFAGLEDVVDPNVLDRLAEVAATHHVVVTLSIEPYDEDDA